MSKIRDSFVLLLEDGNVNPEFANRLKKQMVPGETYANGDAVMTYKDAEIHLKNIIKHIESYPDDGWVDKNFWINQCKEKIGALEHQQYQLNKKPDDPIASFGEFYSGFINKVGNPEFLDQYTKEYLSKPKETQEDVADFNTISDTYRMQDMPQ